MTIGEIAKKSMEGRIYILVKGKVYGVNGFSLLMYDDEPSYDFETSEEVIESRTAEWKRRVQDGTDRCSLCGRWGWRGYKYCPWCGAKMEEQNGFQQQGKNDDERTNAHGTDAHSKGVP